MDGNDLYPEIKRRAEPPLTEKHNDMVRLRDHEAASATMSPSPASITPNTCPYFIKDRYPELIDRFNIPLDEYPRRCVEPDQGLGRDAARVC